MRIVTRDYDVYDDLGELFEVATDWPADRNTILAIGGDVDDDFITVAEQLGKEDNRIITAAALLAHTDWGRMSKLVDLCVGGFEWNSADPEKFTFRYQGSVLVVTGGQWDLYGPHDLLLGILETIDKGKR